MKRFLPSPSHLLAVAVLVVVSSASAANAQNFVTIDKPTANSNFKSGTTIAVSGTCSGVYLMTAKISDGEGHDASVSCQPTYGKFNMQLSIPAGFALGKTTIKITSVDAYNNAVQGGDASVDVNIIAP